MSRSQAAIRMSVWSSRSLTDSEVELIAGLMDGWAEVAEMTEEDSALSEFAKVTKMLLGDDNFQQIRSRARKFGDVESRNLDHQKLIEPDIAVMSLAGRLTDCYERGQATADEYSTQCQRLASGEQKSVTVFVDSRESVPPGAINPGRELTSAQADKLAAEIVDR